MMKRLWISCLCLLIGLWSAEAQDVVRSIKMLLLEDRFEEVILVTDTIAVTDSLKDEIFYFRGHAYQSLLRYDSAYHYYYLAAKLNSNSVSYRVAMGQILTKLGRSREAIEVYNYLLSYDSLNYFFLKQAGRCYEELRWQYGIWKKHVHRIQTLCL